MTRWTCLVPAAVDIDEDGVRVSIDFTHDRMLLLIYPRAGGPARYLEGDWPSVTFWDGQCDREIDDMDIEEFEDWLKVAVGAMAPDRERRFLCQICGESGFGPMLCDEVWAAIAPNRHGMNVLGLHAKTGAGRARPQAGVARCHDALWQCAGGDRTMTASRRWRDLWWLFDHNGGDAEGRTKVMGRKVPSTRMRNRMVHDGQLRRIALPFKTSKYELTELALDMLKQRRRNRYRDGGGRYEGKRDEHPGRE